jgi:PAS domain-containing protein
MKLRTELSARTAKVRFIHERGQTHYDDSGKPIRTFGTAQDITERTLAERQIQEREAILKSFFDSPGHMRGVVEMVEDDILHISDNQASAAFFGRTVEEMRNKLASEMGIPREVIRTWIHHYEQSRSTGQPAYFEYCHQIDNVQKWFSVTVSYLGISESGHPRFAYVMDDVTDAKQTELALMESEKRYRSLFDNSISGFALHEIITNNTGHPIDYRFLEVNRAFEELTGLKSDDICGKKVTEILPKK